MIARLVSFALRQRFLVVVASLALMAWGAWSFRSLPIDAVLRPAGTHRRNHPYGGEKPVARHASGADHPGVVLLSVRTALIVAVTIPFALMFSFICLDWRHIPANLLSIGAIDFGIIVDGSVVMVENIFRELAARHGRPHNLMHGMPYELMDIIRAAAHDVERPIFYAIAVIIAGYLPIYVLSGPSGRLFQPMADTMSFALLGSLLCTLTLLPVLCSYFLRRHVHEPRARVYEWIRGGYGRTLGWCLRHRLVTVALILAVFGSSLLMIPFIGGEFYASPG